MPGASPSESKNAVVPLNLGGAEVTTSASMESSPARCHRSSPNICFEARTWRCIVQRPPAVRATRCSTAPCTLTPSRDFSSRLICDVLSNSEFRLHISRSFRFAPAASRPRALLRWEHPLRGLVSAQRVHSNRRGDGTDHTSAPGVVRSVPPAERMAEGISAGDAAQHRREPLGEAAFSQPDRLTTCKRDTHERNRAGLSRLEITEAALIDKGEAAMPLLRRSSISELRCISMISGRDTHRSSISPASDRRNQDRSDLVSTMDTDDKNLRLVKQSSLSRRSSACAQRQRASLGGAAARAEGAQV